MARHCSFGSRAQRIATRLRNPDDYVWEVARKLAELQRDYLGTSGREPWKDFCAKHFAQWGERYIRQLIEIGTADDPREALADWREANRWRAQNIREARRAAAEAQAQPAVRTAALAQAERDPIRVPTAPALALEPWKPIQAQHWEVLWQVYTTLEPDQRAPFDARWREAHMPQLVVPEPEPAVARL
jgi:hypothetical protein